MITDLLSTDGFIIYNKKLARTIGTNPAILLGYLCSEYNFYSSNGQLDNGMFFCTREKIKYNTGLTETGQKWRSLGNAMWLTNLDNERRHENLKLTQCFNPLIHQKYDNYNAIHVRNITEIPFDYTGIMGVPITIINRYNSEQFEIIGEANHGSDSQYDIFKPILNGKEVFKRILIRNKANAIW